MQIGGTKLQHPARYGTYDEFCNAMAHMRDNNMVFLLAITASPPVMQHEPDTQPTNN